MQCGEQPLCRVCRLWFMPCGGSHMKCKIQLMSNKTKIDVASHPKQQPYACQVFRVDGRHHTLDAATVNWRG
eukprot:scaffold15374_cov35-Cyclotella_meneghiniana.AAC.1